MDKLNLWGSRGMVRPATMGGLPGLASSTRHGHIQSLRLKNQYGTAADSTVSVSARG